MLSEPRTDALPITTGCMPRGGDSSRVRSASMMVSSLDPADLFGAVSRGLSPAFARHWRWRLATGPRCGPLGKFISVSEAPAKRSIGSLARSTSTRSTLISPEKQGSLPQIGTGNHARPASMKKAAAIRIEGAAVLDRRVYRAGTKLILGVVGMRRQQWVLPLGRCSAAGASRRRRESRRRHSGR